MGRDPHKIVRDWKGRFSRTASHRSSKNTKELKAAITERRTSVAEAARKSRSPSRPKAAKATPSRPNAPTAPTPKRETHLKVQQDLTIGMGPDGLMDYEVRGQYVDKRLDELRALSNEVAAKAQAGEEIDKSNPGDTKNRYFNWQTGTYEPEREKLHRQLIDAYWKKNAAHVPNEGKAMFSGGLGGSGKGFTLKNRLGIKEQEDKNFLTVNPDIVKEIMAEMGMVDEDFDPNLTPMERSAVVHEEASDIAGMIADKAYDEKKNMIWDLTMSSDNSINKRIKKLRAAGYTHIEAIFVDVDVPRSKVGAKKRWIRGMEEYQEKPPKSMGGRYLPSSATKDNMPKEGSPYMSNNRQVFENIKGNLDGTTRYENVDDGTEFGTIEPREQTGIIQIGEKLKK